MAVGGNGFERVSSFPDVGSVISDDNSISEEITHGTKEGNRARYAYKRLITSA
jgi:hypothetical protein